MPRIGGSRHILGPGVPRHSDPGTLRRPLRGSTAHRLHQVRHRGGGLGPQKPLPAGQVRRHHDILSDGRLVLGLGLGGVHPKDLEVEGIPNLRERGRVSNERLEILYRLFTEKNVSHSGDYYQFEDFTLTPEPVQRPHVPIWVGARWTGKIFDAALKRAGTYADVFIFPADTPTDYYPGAKEKIRKYAEAAGRDPGDIRYASTLWTCLASSREEAKAIANREITRCYKSPGWSPTTPATGSGRRRTA